MSPPPCGRGPTLPGRSQAGFATSRSRARRRRQLAATTSPAPPSSPPASAPPPPLGSRSPAEGGEPRAVRAAARLRAAAHARRCAALRRRRRTSWRSAPAVASSSLSLSQLSRGRRSKMAAVVLPCSSAISSVGSTRAAASSSEVDREGPAPASSPSRTHSDSHRPPADGGELDRSAEPAQVAPGLDEADHRPLEGRRRPSTTQAGPVDRHAASRTLVGSDPGLALAEGARRPDVVETPRPDRRPCQVLEGVAEMGELASSTPGRRRRPEVPAESPARPTPGGRRVATRAIGGRLERWALLAEEVEHLAVVGDEVVRAQVTSPVGSAWTAASPRAAFAGEALDAPSVGRVLEQLRRQRLAGQLHADQVRDAERAVGAAGRDDFGTATPPAGAAAPCRSCQPSSGSSRGRLRPRTGTPLQDRGRHRLAADDRLCQQREGLARGPRGEAGARRHSARSDRSASTASRAATRSIEDFIPAMVAPPSAAAGRPARPGRRPRAGQ